MQSRFHLILLLILTLAAVVAVAEPSSSAPALKVTILDTSGAVITGAEIVISSPDGSRVAHGVSDSGGNFIFAGLPAGSYTVEVSKSGFSENKQQLKAGATGHAPVRIVMRS